jgi:hypothetical protein
MLGVGPVAVLEVDRDRQAGRLIQRACVIDDLVQRDAPVQAPERERESGAGRGERLEAERLEDPG